VGWNAGRLGKPTAFIVTKINAGSNSGSPRTLRRWKRDVLGELTPPTKVAGTLRRAVRSAVPFAMKLLPGFRVDGTWNVPTTMVDGTWNVPTTMVDGTWNVPTTMVDCTWNVPTTLTFVRCVLGVLGQNDFYALPRFAKV
jgi:hypothetical protein